jgi:glycosyltransferase involved in cell wall biosynthesis
MRILIVSHYFWPEQFRINDLARELKNRGHRVAVLTGMPNYPGGKMFSGYSSWWAKRHDIMDGIPVYRTPMFARREGRGWQLALNYFSFVFWACLLGPWYFRRHRFDVIFVYEPSPFTVGIPALLMRRLKKAPILFWVQDLWPESLEAAGAIRSTAVLAMVGAMVRWIYRGCDRVLVQSRGFVEPAVKAGAYRERISYFPNWAEAIYRPVELPTDASEYEELPLGFKVMFAGNLGEAQSLETIVGAANRLRDVPDIHWVIIGDGRRMSWMRSEILSLGLDGNVHFLGRRPVESMPRYFAAADALLVTLKADPVFTLTIPSKVQSYLACARPIIGALDGEGADVIQRAGAGLVAGAGDVAGLAEAVLSLYAMSAADRNVMGKRGRDYFENEFSPQALINKLEGWMHDMSQVGICES